MSTGLNALVLYGDRPFGLGTLYGYATNPETGERERFVISDPADLDQEFVYAKERRLLEEVKTELRQGRRVQIFAVYTQKRDVTQRLKNILSREGNRIAGSPLEVPKDLQRWYDGVTQVTLPCGRMVTPAKNTFLKYNACAFEGQTLLAPNGRYIADQYWVGGPRRTTAISAGPAGSTST